MTGTPPPPPPPPPPPLPPQPVAITSVTPPAPAPVGGQQSKLLLALAAIGVVSLLGLAAVGAVALLSGGDSADDAAVDGGTTEPSEQPDARVASTEPATDPAVGGEAADPDEDESANADASSADEAVVPASAPAPTTTTTTTVEAETAPPVDDAANQADEADPVADDGPAESRAVVRNGQIFLEGAVPTAEAGAAIEDLAAEILGPDNVFNNYVVDPDAGDPNIGNITVEDTINFATNSADILPEAEGLLNQGLALMTIRPAMTITIVGHTDSRGTAEGNQILSEQRAESVKEWFVVRGVDADRLTTVGAGQSQPIADNDTPEGRRLNRRIQFFLENILGE